jgi:hypothetical protein
MGKTNVSLASLKKAVDISNVRLTTNRDSFDVARDARTNANYNAVRNLPEFQSLTAPK